MSEHTAEKDACPHGVQWSRFCGACMGDEQGRSVENGPPAPVAVTYEEWGVETRWGIEWGASVGTSHRYEYTAESVWGLAGGRPVFRRFRTTYRDHVTEPERVFPPEVSKP